MEVSSRTSLQGSLHAHLLLEDCQPYSVRRSSSSSLRVTSGIQGNGAMRCAMHSVSIGKAVAKCPEESLNIARRARGETSKARGTSGVSSSRTRMRVARMPLVSATASGSGRSSGVEGQGQGLGLLGRLGRVLKEKATSDFERVFKGVSKTRERLAVVDELLTYWNLNEAESILEELEEALIVADFGPRTALRIVDGLRAQVDGGELKTGSDIRRALKAAIVSLLTDKAPTSQLQLPQGEDSGPAVIMVVGVNGGGKTTTIGKLAHRFKEGGSTVMLAAGDTFRAAAAEQLSVWAVRAGADITSASSQDRSKARPANVLSAAVKRAMDEGFDIVLADTSGRLHTNFNLMEELKACKRAIQKTLPSSPHEVLLVLDGTTGLNMLPQARQFNEAVGITGFVLTKLDGTARGGCVASVVDELGIAVKFVGVGEGLQDLQPFDAVSFVDALFPEN